MTESLAAFRDLCLDSTDPEALAPFWAATLAWEPRRDDDGWRLTPPEGGGPGLWVDRVPEARTVKNRVHLDIRLPAADPGPLVGFGATVLREPTDDGPWWVLADPEGDEFCAFPPAPPEWNADVDIPTPFELVADSGDAPAQAEWWGRVFGVEAQRHPGGFGFLQGVAGFPWYAWVFNPVPEPKSAKNRMHWDIDLAPGHTVAELVDLGARVLRAPDHEIEWTVLSDPEGNEFCAFA